jgi:hypothetical protein
MADKRNQDLDESIQKEQRNAVWYGTVSVSLGLLAGLPYTVKIFAIRDEWASSTGEIVEMEQDPFLGFIIRSLIPRVIGTERAWRMAHLEG